MSQDTLPATRSSFQPLAPIGTPSALKSLLESQRNGIAQALPKHITPERLIKTMLVASNRTPDILKCTMGSIVETINRAAELGLDLSGTLGEAYPVPFNNKVKASNGEMIWVMQCTLIIGYRGFAKLAWQSGEIKRIEAEVVYSKDAFTFRKGMNFTLDFVPNMTGDRGEPIGAYAFVELKSGGVMAEFMPASDIEKVRAKSKSANSPAWSDPLSRMEMYRKTPFRRLAKWLPLSTEKFVAAVEHDAESDGFHDVIEASTTVQTIGGKAQAIADRYKKADEEPELGAQQSQGSSQRPIQDAGGDGDSPANASERPTVVSPAIFNVSGGPGSNEPGPAPAVGSAAEKVAIMDEEGLTQEWPKALEYIISHYEGQLTPSEVSSGIAKWVLNLGKKGKEGAIKLVQRQALLNAIRDGSFNFGTGMIE